MKKVVIYISALLFTIGMIGCSNNSKKDELNKKPEINNVVTNNEEIKVIEDTFILDDIEPNNGNKLRIAFIGDSITYGYKTEEPEIQSYPGQLNELFAERYKIGNFGKNSAYILNTDSIYNVKTDEIDRYYRNTSEYEDSLRFNADVVVIMLGVNDIRSIYGIEEAQQEFVNDLAALAEEYANLDGVQKVYIATSIPCYVSTAFITEMASGQLQELQREAAEKAGVEVIDIFSSVKDELSDLNYYDNDRLHLTVKGQGVLAKAFYDFFRVKE